MIEALGLFALGLLLLALGGDSLVKGASGLSQRYGLSPFATGLLLVAFGTSLPELAVNARAVWAGSQALALGNAVGSNIANFGLTLGVAAMVAPLLVRWRVLAPLLLCFIAVSVLVVVLGWDGVLSRAEGLILLLAFVVVLVLGLTRTRLETAELREEVTAYTNTRTDPVLNALRFMIAAVLLYFGAKWVVQAAPIVGLGLGMEPLLTGLLPVAIGTALPELAAAVVAARRGQGSMVAGHVIGSSLFNLTVVLGGMATFRAMPLPSSFVRFEVPAALALALVLYPMLKGDLRISRREGGVLAVAFVAWVAFELYAMQH